MDTKGLKVRQKPYVSVNKLAEYVDLPGKASGRRLKLLRMLKFPDGAGASWYGEARPLIAQFFLDRDAAPLAAAANALRAARTGTKRQIELRDKSAEALETFLTRVVDRLPSW